MQDGLTRGVSDHLLIFNVFSENGRRRGEKRTSRPWGHHIEWADQSSLEQSQSYFILFFNFTCITMI